MVLPFKPNLLSSSFTWYYLFCMQFKVVSLWMKSYGVTIRMKPPGGGGVLDISLGGEVRRGPSYPDPV